MFVLIIFLTVINLKIEPTASSKCNLADLKFQSPHGHTELKITKACINNSNDTIAMFTSINESITKPNLKVPSIKRFYFQNLDVRGSPFDFDSFINITIKTCEKAQFIEFANIIFNKNCSINVNITLNTEKQDFERINQLTFRFLNNECFKQLPDILFVNDELLQRTILSFRNLSLNNFDPLSTWSAKYSLSYAWIYGIDMSYNYIKIFNNSLHLPINLKFLDMSSSLSLEYISETFFERFPCLKYLEMYGISQFFHENFILRTLVFSSRIVSVKFNTDHLMIEESKQVVNLGSLFKETQTCSAEDQDFAGKKCLFTINFTKTNRSLTVENCKMLEFGICNEEETFNKISKYSFYFRTFQVMKVKHVKTIDSMIKCLNHSKIFGPDNLSRVELDQIGNMRGKFDNNNNYNHILNPMHLRILSLFGNRLVSINLNSLPYKSLFILDLSYNALETFVDPAATNNDIVSFKHFRNLTQLYLNNNRLKIIGKLEFSPHCTRLDLVNLAHNQLTSLDEIHVPVLNQSLEILLNYNNLQDLPVIFPLDEKERAFVENLDMSNQRDGMFKGDRIKNEVTGSARINKLNLSHNGLQTTNRRFLYFLVHLLSTSFMGVQDENTLLELFKTEFHKEFQRTNILFVDFVDLSYNSLFIYSLCDLHLYFCYYNSKAPQPFLFASVTKLKLFPLQKAKNDLASNEEMFPSSNCQMESHLNMIIFAAFAKCLPNGMASVPGNLIEIVNDPTSSCKTQLSEEQPNTKLQLNTQIGEERLSFNSSMWAVNYCTHSDRSPSVRQNSLGTKFDEALYLFDEVIMPLLFRDYFYFIMVFLVIFFFFYAVIRRYLDTHGPSGKNVLKKLDSDQLIMYYEYLKTVLQK
jgi:hypothetical protein